MLQLKPDRLGIDDFIEQPVVVCGKRFLADMSGALYWPAERALIIADMHLEKGSAYAMRGQMLPPYDTRDTLDRLAHVIDRYQAETVIALGDSFHDALGPSRMHADDLARLRMMQDHCEWIWITGNHDPEKTGHLGGHVLNEIVVEGIHLRHEPGPTRVTHEIAGHLHPAAKVTLNGLTLRRPCFVGNGLRLVLPAFGSYAGGLNVLDAAFGNMFSGERMAVWLLGQEGLYPVATRLLRPD
jgi:DNA ligase-associated metallophosphoesterase